MTLLNCLLDVISYFLTHLYLLTIGLAVGMDAKRLERQGHGVTMEADVPECSYLVSQEFIIIVY